MKDYKDVVKVGQVYKVLNGNWKFKVTSVSPHSVEFIKLDESNYTGFYYTWRFFDLEEAGLELMECETMNTYNVTILFENGLNEFWIVNSFNRASVYEDISKVKYDHGEPIQITVIKVK